LVWLCLQQRHGRILLHPGLLLLLAGQQAQHDACLGGLI
jgi:hypothetical protein